MKLDRPRAVMRRTLPPSQRKARGRSRRIARRLNKNHSAQAADTACDRMVARAAPGTPMSKPKMNTGSRMRLSTAPMATVSMPVPAKPWVLMK